MTDSAIHRSYYETSRYALLLKAPGTEVLPVNSDGDRYYRKHEVEYGREAMKKVDELRSSLVENVEEVEKLIEIIRKAAEECDEDGRT